MALVIGRPPPPNGHVAAAPYAGGVQPLDSTACLPALNVIGTQPGHRGASCPRPIRGASRMEARVHDPWQCRLAVPAGRALSTPNPRCYSGKVPTRVESSCALSAPVQAGWGCGRRDPQRPKDCAGVARGVGATPDRRRSKVTLSGEVRMVSAAEEDGERAAIYEVNGARLRCERNRAPEKQIRPSAAVGGATGRAEDTHGSAPDTSERWAATGNRGPRVTREGGVRP